ncbi:MAG: cell division ATP-binding protein FtsE [Coriobacteriia bacterium]|nr:cell division ATP-binding protein FtsE [Coriobacteriia bacterium]
MAQTDDNRHATDLTSLPDFGEDTETRASSFEGESETYVEDSRTSGLTVEIPDIEQESSYDENSYNEYESSEEPTYGAGTYNTQAQQENEPMDEAMRPCNSGPAVITMSHVSKVYPAQPNKPALQDISMRIAAGEFVFLVGHSGSGKSTFIRMLTREIKPSSGSVIVAGQDLVGMRDWKVPYLRRNIGCVFQDFKLLPEKTAYENVAFALEAIGKSKHVIRTQVPEVLRLVGLGEKMNAYPDELSGGEQQRVTIARAFVNRPPLLLCDEPTGNLDPAISLGIMKLLERINRTGTTVLVATHDREMVDSMRRRVITLENGSMVSDVENGVYGCYGDV